MVCFSFRCAMHLIHYHTLYSSNVWTIVVVVWWKRQRVGRKVVNSQWGMRCSRSDLENEHDTYMRSFFVNNFSFFFEGFESYRESTMLIYHRQTLYGLFLSFHPHACICLPNRSIQTKYYVTAYATYVFAKNDNAAPNTIIDLIWNSKIRILQ